MIQSGIPKSIFVLPIVVMTIGLLAILGELFHATALLRLHPAFPLLSYMTAFCLLLASAGVLAWIYGRLNVMRVCTFLLLCVAAIDLLQAGLGWGLGVDGLRLADAILGRSGLPPRIGVSAALCFVLLSGALGVESFAASKARCPFLAWYLSAMVLLLTLLSLAIETLSAPQAIVWSEYLRMALLTGVGLLLLCATIIIITYRRSQAERNFKLQRLSILGVGVLGIGLTVFYWYALHHDSYHNALARFKKDSEHYSHMITQRLEVYRIALQRQAQRLQHNPSDAASAMDLKSYITDFPALDQLQLRTQGAAPTAPSRVFTQPGFQPVDSDWLAPFNKAANVANLKANEMAFEMQTPHVVMYVGIGDRQQHWIVAYVNLKKIAGGLIPRTVVQGISGFFTAQAVHYLDRNGHLVLTEAIRIGGKPVAQLVLQSSTAWFEEYDNQAYIAVIIGGLLVTLLLGLLINRNFRWRATHESLSRLQDIVPIGLLAVDALGRIEFANHFMLDLIGYTKEEIIGLPVEALVAPELTDHASWRRGFVKLASSRAMGEGMLEIVHKNAARIPVEIALNVLRTAKGPVTMVTVVNAAERARLLYELSSQKNHLENLLDSMGEGVWGINQDGLISFVNPAACEMLGYVDEDELLGKVMHDIVHYKYPDGTDYPRLQCRIDRSLEDGESHEVDDEVFWRKDGTSIPVEYVSTPVHNGTELVGVVVVFHDISQRQRLVALEKEYQRNLERVNQELKEFSYVASHDLQEPLRTLKGYCEFLTEDIEANDAQGVSRDIRVITNAAERMQQLIKDLLEYSRSGRAVIDLLPVDLNDCLHVAVDNLEHLIKSTQATVTLDEFPPVLGDATMLTRILQNLIHNAIKFRGDNRPEVHITRLDDGKDRLTICITDNGIGIDAKYHEVIFNAFKRLHRVSEYEGSGLGLAIVKKIIDKHHGQIRLKSTPGLGSQFYISLLTVDATVNTSNITAIY